MYARQAYDKSRCRQHAWDRLLPTVRGEGTKRVLLAGCVHATAQGALVWRACGSYREALSCG